MDSLLMVFYHLYKVRYSDTRTRTAAITHYVLYLLIEGFTKPTAIYEKKPMGKEL